MANKPKRRFKVRGEDGRIRTVNAQSHSGAKKLYARIYGADLGYHVVVWPMGEEDDKRNMRVTRKDLS